ncbi:MAG: endonuclease/exonuclease/phosphatase family protein [Fibrobacteres bacterium]|nr:endonuclease/exonuclease/phosphatase family protein [Fibrobacterota bacterium]
MKLFFIMLVYLLIQSCSDNKPTQEETPASQFLPPSALDTTLSLITINMAVGFDAERMITKDLTKPQLVLEEGLYLYNQLKESMPNQRIKVLSDSIKGTMPDIVALQEVLLLINRHNSDTIDFINTLMKELSTDYAVITQVMNPLDIKVNTSDSISDSVNIYFHEGNAIIYKKSALSLITVDSLTYFFGIRNIKYLNTTISILRGAQYAKFSSTKGTFINVFNTHLEVESVPLLGMNQAFQLNDYINYKVSNHEAVVIMGDLNNTANSSTLRVFKNGNFFDTHSDPRELSCCYDIVNIDVPATRRLDYVLARYIVNVNNATVRFYKPFTNITNGLQYRISDHAAVSADLSFH